MKYRILEASLIVMLFVFLMLLVFGQSKAFSWQNNQGMTQLEIWDMQNRLYDIQQAQERQKQIQWQQERRQWERDQAIRQQERERQEAVREQRNKRNRRVPILMPSPWDVIGR